MDADFWNQRYAGEEYAYGTAPNDFVAEVAARIPAGPVLCLAEGEGRNAVHLAERGHAVTAVDQSEVALTKARKLAAARGATVETVTADLSGYRILPEAWAGIVATWAHLPPAVRREVHAQVVRGLQHGGLFILEAYTPAQLAHQTGGPRSVELLMTAAQLREELTGLEFEVLREVERDVREGTAHTGRAAVVQVLARRP
jgi:SAM-dependent methyltransferase